MNHQKTLDFSKKYEIPCYEINWESLKAPFDRDFSINFAQNSSFINLKGR